jgi:hypothetical protein
MTALTALPFLKNSSLENLQALQRSGWMHGESQAGCEDHFHLVRENHRICVRSVACK